MECALCGGSGGWPDLNGSWVTCKPCYGTGQERNYPPPDTEVTPEGIAEMERRAGKIPEGSGNILFSMLDVPGKIMSRIDDTTTLWDGEYWTPELMEPFQKLYKENPDIWYVQVMTKDGKELMIFNGQHPPSKIDEGAEPPQKH